MSELAIQTEGLHKTYGKLRAVDGLSLRVPRGAVYGFLGRNGAGKTTTIKMLLGLVHPTAGSARVLGLDALRDSTAILARSAFVSENKALYDDWTLSDLARFTRGFYPGWSDPGVASYAKRLDVPMKQKFRALSKGNRAKACLLLALAQNAELLFLDEPTAGLDPLMIDEVLRILVEDHVGDGRTVFFSSHQLAEVEQVADWVGIIDQGKLLLEARLEDIRENFRLVIAAGRGLPESASGPVLSVARADAFCRYILARDAKAFAAQLQQQGASITEVSPLNLREVFLALVRKEEACTSGNSGAIPVGTSSAI